MKTKNIYYHSDGSWSTQQAPGTTLVILGYGLTSSQIQHHVNKLLVG